MLVTLEREPRLELQVVAIQVLELLEVDTLGRLEEDTQGSSLDKELLGEDTLALVPLVLLVPLVATQEQDRVLQVEGILELVPLEAVTLVREELHLVPPKVAIQGVLQEATQEVLLLVVTQAKHLQASKVPILEQHPPRLTLRFVEIELPHLLCTETTVFNSPRT